MPNQTVERRGHSLPLQAPVTAATSAGHRPHRCQPPAEPVDYKWVFRWKTPSRSSSTASQPQSDHTPDQYGGTGSCGMPPPRVTFPVPSPAPRPRPNSVCISLHTASVPRRPPQTAGCLQAQCGRAALELLPSRLPSVSHPSSQQKSNVLLWSLHGIPGRRGVPVCPPPHGCLLAALCRGPSPGRGSSAGFCRWTLVHVGLCGLASPLVPSSRTPCLCRRSRPAAVLWAPPGLLHPLGWSSVSFFILSLGSERGKRLDANRTLHHCPQSQEALGEGRINTGTNTYSKPPWNSESRARVPSQPPGGLPGSWLLPAFQNLRPSI